MQNENNITFSYNNFLILYIIWLLYARSTKNSDISRKYMQGPALDDRIRIALQSAFEVMDGNQGDPIDTIEYISYMVGNIITGLCFGGQ